MTEPKLSSTLSSSLAAVGAEEQKRFEAQPKSKKSKNKTQINMTLWMARSTHKALTGIARTRDISLQQLVAVAVDRVLAEEGEEPFKQKDE